MKKTFFNRIPGSAACIIVSACLAASPFAAMPVCAETNVTTSESKAIDSGILIDTETSAYTSGSAAGGGDTSVDLIEANSSVYTSGSAADGGDTSVDLIEAKASVYTSVSADGAASDAIVYVSKADIASSGFLSSVNGAIKNASLAYENDGIARTVKLEAGSYTAAHAITLFSNVTVDFTGSTITRSGGSNLVFAGVSQSETAGATGYYIQNVTMIGGIFDCGGGSSTGFKIAHIKNFTMENVTVRNTKEAHLVEIAGCDGLTLKNCTFKDQLSNGTENRYEAVQLDVLAKSHFNNYRYEPLPTRNVYVSGCTFENVPRGIGSHTSIFNAPINNIKIINNTFTNCSSIAVQGCSWRNVTITGNTINGAPRGIVLYGVNSTGGLSSSRGTFLASTIAAEGNLTTDIPDKLTSAGESRKINISNNILNLNNSKDPQAGYDRVGIMVHGTKITEVTTYSNLSGGLAKGTYSIKDVTILGNKITTGGIGIRVIYAENVKISRNTISRTKNAPSGNIYGIHAAAGSNKVVISGNTIKRDFLKGISCSNGAKVTEISSNKIYRTKTRGISLENASCTKIINNTVNRSGEYGINLTVGSKAGTISGNTNKKCGKKQIRISKGCTVKKLKKNK